jgi:beta-galactosidase
MRQASSTIGRREASRNPDLARRASVSQSISTVLSFFLSTNQSLRNPRFHVPFSVLLFMKYFFSLLVLALYPFLLPAEDSNSPTTALADSAQVRTHSIAFPSLEEAMKPASTTSPWLQKLNGNWKFFYAADPTKKVTGFAEISFDDSSWKEIAVPSNWQMKDYGKPTIYSSAQPIRELKSIGQYRHEFTIPEGWKSRKTSLCFDGVDSAFTLWINGKPMGFAEDSRAAQEFDITTFLIDGKNMLAVEVYQFSGHTPDQKREGFQLSGIYRDVYLQSRHDISLDDAQIHATLADDFTTGQLNCNLTMQNTSAVDAEIKATLTLIDAQGASLATPSVSVHVAANQSAKLVLKSENLAQIKPWSAEFPQLYRAYLSLQDATGKIFAYHRWDIGFRRSEMKDGKYFHNGKNITLKGVSRVDFHHSFGHVLTEEKMKTELLQLKRGNFNAIWNDHSPSDELFLALCDRMGFYLIEAANNIDLPTDDAEVRKQRISHLVTTRRNHPSVIAWLAANESEKSTFQELCGSRPVFDRSFVDAFIPLKDFSISKSEVIPGTVEDPVPKMPPLPRVKTPKVDPNAPQPPPRPKIRRFAVSGADIDPQITDAYYGGKGLLLASGMPKPIFEEWKKCNQEITTTVVDTNANTLQVMVKNQFYFRTLDFVKGSWKLLKNGEAVAGGELPMTAILPQQHLEIPISITEAKDPNAEYFFRVRYDLTETTEWYPTGMPIAWEEIPLPWGKRTPASLAVAKDVPTFSENDAQITLSAKEASAVIDKKTGALISWKRKDQEVLLEPMSLSFWRPNSPTRREEQRVWQAAGKGATCISSKVFIKEGTVQAVMELSLAAGKSTATINYRWNGNGDFNVETDFRPDATLPDLTNIGYALRIDNSFLQLRWYGKGAQETYPDCEKGAWSAIHHDYLPSMFFRHTKPQETSNRSGIRWAEYTRAMGGQSIRVESSDDHLLNVAVYPNGVDAVDQAKNQTELATGSFYELRINHRQAPVRENQEAGNISAKESYHWSFLLSSRLLPPTVPTTAPNGGPLRRIPMK